MERFVIRSPTWKTLNYSSVAAQVLQKNCSTKNIGGNTQQRQLQQKQLNKTVPNTYDCGKRLYDLLPSSQRANSEYFTGNSDDSGLSSASSISPQPECEELLSSSKLLPPAKSQYSRLNNYCPVEKENAICMGITRTLKPRKKVMKSAFEEEQTVEVNKNFNIEVNGTPENLLLKTNNMIMARIQRDLSSPSATTRLKAIKAMKSPTKSAYAQFDVPEEEQSLYLPDPPSLQEIMRNIVVYVEVRSGEDNRSAGVRKVIEALGARVSLSLNRETTHVIFKDGLLSTFKKATQMNIPIVSILWIEACKNQRRICDPKDYPISNLDRYENPELYTKMKRVKSMQPDSECNKRIRAKAGGTPKDSTPTQKTGNPKKTSTVVGGTPTSSTNKKKTDITQFFKKIEKPTPSSVTKVLDCTTTTTCESPATQLLNRIHSECYTPLKTHKTNTITQNCTIITNTTHSASVALNFLQSDNAERNIKASITSNIVVGIKATTVETPNPPMTRGRRRSLMADCEIETATSSMNTMAICGSTPIKPNTRRRNSSINTPKDMSLSAETPTNFNNIEPIIEETHEVEKAPKANNKRRTLYAAKTMDQTDLMKCTTPTLASNSTRRRTLYKSKTMETSDTQDIVNNVPSNGSHRRRTCFRFKSLGESENLAMTETKAATTTSQGNEIANEAQMVTPVNKRANKPLNFTGTFNAANETISESNRKTFASNITEDSSISLTPTTNFQKDKVISSTFLAENDNRSKLVATPTADVTNDKLLEETGECATPLVFSSTRQPGSKRRTLFDVSMDIITQRLQCINQSARRSLAPPTPAEDVVINTSAKAIATPINIIQARKKLYHCTTPNASSTESLNECTNDNNNGIAEAVISVKKKRKLFVANELLSTPPPPPAAEQPLAGLVALSVHTNHSASLKTADETAKLNAHNAIVNNCDSSATKRRRTLMPISQPQPTTTTAVTLIPKDAAAAVRKRRSTLDFERMQTVKTKSTNGAKDSSSQAATKQAIAQQQQQQLKTKKTPVLVYTNMHQQQIDVIRETIDKLGIFSLESCVTDHTTHLVSLEPRRTLNLLRALGRGLWILSYAWIAESAKARKWLPEEFYELENFSRAIEVSRSERQAFGNKYKCDLFRKFGSFYISSNCSPISKENMRELIILCGGHVVNARKKARYIIGDANRTLADKLYLTPYWVLDSITQMQLMKVSKYLYRQSDDKVASQAPILDSPK